MLTAEREHRPPVAADGFTLIELVVAMAIAIVVLMGLLSIVVMTLHQTQRAFTTVDATRQSRTALATIENELHSGCTNGSSSPPIQSLSTGSNLVFLSFYGNGTNPKPIWHELTFSGTTLVDHTYQTTANPNFDGSGSTAAYLRGAAAASTTLLTNVSQQRTIAGVAIPVFQYFAYQQAGTDSAGDTYYVVPDGSNMAPGSTTPVTASPLDASGSGLTMANANSTVEVMLSLLVGASSENLNNRQLSSVSAPVTDSISLRLTTPPDYVAAASNPTGYGPCQ
jgi:type II secretory pathway pseudopilin PulG